MGLLSSLFLRRNKKGVLVKEWELSLDTKITSQLSSGFLDEESIVIGSNDGKIYAISSSGKVKWAYAVSKAVSKEEMFFLEDESFSKIKSTPYIADINNDAKGEVIFGTEFGMLNALSHDGRLLWSFKAKDAVSGSAFAYDINSDKKPEVLFGSSDHNFYALSSNGKLLWKFKANSGIESQPAVISASRKQIVFGTNDGTVYSLDEKGKELWRFRANDKVTAQPAHDSIYNDGRTFIIFGSFDNSLYALTEAGGLHWAYRTEGKIFSKAVLADINADKKIEIAIGSCDDKVHVLSASGSKIWDYETNFWVVSSPIVADFNNDNRLEISICSYDNFVYILEGEGKYTLDYMPGISGITAQAGHYTDLAISEPGSYIGKLLSKYKVDGTAMGHDLLSQSNCIAVATDMGKIYKLRFRDI